MTETSAWEKLIISLINTLPVVIVSIPFLVIWGFSIEYRVVLSVIFLIQQIITIFMPGRRGLGMMLTNVSWNKEYKTWNHVVYALLYSLSFSTIIIWVVFPFDVMLMNLILIQLPLVHFTGYTLHGYLSGRMSGHKNDE